MMKRIPALLSILASILLANCSNESPETEPPPPTPQGPKLVGRIASIPADKRFVLIQGYGRWNIQPGTILTTRGDNNRSANLLVTGESLGQFAAADIQSGLVEIGDAVYSQHVPQPAESSSQPESPARNPQNPLKINRNCPHFKTPEFVQNFN